MTSEDETNERGILGRIGIVLNRFVYSVLDLVAESSEVMFRERELFLGTGLFILGLLNYNIGRYCDGNTAEYLSCTRPAVYYWFDMFDITLIILGVFLIVVWCVRGRRV